MSSKGWVMRKREQFELFARTVEARPGLAPAQPSYKPAEAAHGEAEVGDKYLRVVRCCVDISRWLLW